MDGRVAPGVGGSSVGSRPGFLVTLLAGCVNSSPKT
jgi:hypothetical protein